MTKADLYDVLFSAGAENDIEAIHEYITLNGSLDAAGKLIGTFYERVDELERFPLRGAVPRELAKDGVIDIRQIVTYPYRIFYKIADCRVLVILVVDGRRDMQSLLRQRMLEAP